MSDDHFLGRPGSTSGFSANDFDEINILICIMSLVQKGILKTLFIPCVLENCLYLKKHHQSVINLLNAIDRFDRGH